MEYTIYNESLVYYALRNPETLEYLHIVDGHPWTGYLHCCTMFSSINKAKEAIKDYPQFNQIRQVKVIDIGEVCSE